jgi:hypothetical protein
MKVLLRAIPYAIVVVFVLTQANFQRLQEALVARGPRYPTQPTGEVWEIAYRGGAVRYVTFQDYIVYFLPHAMAPLFIGAVVWILIDLRKAGLGDRQR